MEEKIDLFVCHAGEDKEIIVTPIVNALNNFGINVWYDESELEAGDNLIESIERGLQRSQNALVVISPNFLDKYLKEEWPKYEMDSLITKGIGSKNTIIPILHNVSPEELKKLIFPFEKSR